MSPPRLFVAGAGAAGTAMALALSRAGYPLGEIACRGEQRARQRVELLAGGQAVSLEHMARGAPVQGEALLLLVSVPDRFIGPTATALAGRRWPPGSVALHLSGSVEVDALAPLARVGLATGAFHPLKSFVDVERDAATMAGTLFAIEGSAAAIAAARRAADVLGGRAALLAPGSRALYHAAASHACNHLVALVDQALDLLEAAGVGREAGRAALIPLLASTVANLEAHPPAEALTGPVSRGDTEVVARHLRALAQAPADVAAAYRALARRAVQLARSQGLSENLVNELLAMLPDQP